MKPLGSIEALVAAVRDDAAAEAEALNAAAAAKEAAITADPLSCPPHAGDERRALAVARDRARVRVSQEDWNDARETVAQREEWIQRVVAEGSKQLQERLAAADARAALAVLAREAISRLPAGPIELAVAEADAPLLDRDWCATISPTGNAGDLRIVSERITGGCISRSADGRASFDNSYEARIERLQALWRAALADLYERVTSDIALGRERGA